MSKKPIFKTETCGGKYVLKNTEKPQHYLQPNGKLTPFADDNTVMFQTETEAKQMAKLLNNNPTAQLIKFVSQLHIDVNNTGDAAVKAYIEKLLNH